MRLGVFGGSFDPVHYGHLILAECCREQCRLDQVLLVPAGSPPHKRGRTLTAGEARVEMLELAVGGDEHLAVSRHEIDRGGLSYTVDTLRRLRGERPDDELFLLVGADMLADLPHWRESAAVCELAVVVAVGRPGFPEPDHGGLVPVVGEERVDLFRRHRVEMPQIGLSSSELRDRVARGLSLRYRTPRAVEEYIRAHGLYRAAEV